jgi:hypothetical protein
MFPTRPSDPKLETLKKELCSNPDILCVTRAWNPFYNEGTMNGFSWEGKKEGDDVYFHMIGADVDYAKPINLRLRRDVSFLPNFQLIILQ